MSDLNKLIQFTRNNLLKEIEGMSPEVFDVQPKGFNNTIHWQIGHILTIAEQCIFSYPQTTNLPANYKELFGNGSKQADWKDGIPSVTMLTQQLQEQFKRILDIPEARFSEKLPRPFIKFETVGEIIAFNVFHETYHLGQIHAMKRVIDVAK